jgi:adenylosuccinate synthase
MPMHADDFENISPIYETIAGWSETTFGTQKLSDLPEAAKSYIKRIEDLVGAPVDIVSTGPDRIETVVLRHSFD